MEDKLKFYAALVFTLCFIGLIILLYVKIWISGQTLLAELAETFALTCFIILIYALYDSEKEKIQKAEEKKQKRKSFKEHLELKKEKCL